MSTVRSAEQPARTAVTPAGPELVDWLRAQPDSVVAALLAARPDLLRPVAADIPSLAARAMGRSSIEIALDRLDAGALQVVEALTLAPQASSAAVADLLGVGEQALAPTLSRLRAAALVWGDDDALRIPPALADLLPMPADLGPPARMLLAEIHPSQLPALVDDLGLTPADSSVTSALEAVGALLEDPERVADLLGRVPAEAREVLELLAAGPPIGRIPAARRVVDARSADTPVRWLLAHGLLIAIDDATVALPREVGRAVRGSAVFGEVVLDPPACEVTSRELADVDAAAAAQAFGAVRLVERLLETWGVDPPGVLRAGGLGVRELRRAARELEVGEELAAVLIEAAHDAGLLAPDAEAGEVWLPTTGYDSWLTRATGERWAALVGGWLTTTRVAGLAGRRDDSPLGHSSPANALGPDLDRALAPIVRRDVLRTLADLTAGAAPTIDGLVATLRWASPRRGGQLRDELVGWTVREAELFGVTGRGALSSFGRAAAGALLGDPEQLEVAAGLLEPLLPAPLDHILLQADLTAVAPGPLESELARRLALMADVESTGGATVFRFSDASVRRALDAGASAADLHALLGTRSRTPVPQPLSYLIDDVARRHGRLRIGAVGAYLRCDDDNLLNEVLADRKTDGLRLRRIAPGVLVGPLPPDRVVARLRELGYAPAAEDTEGGLLLRRPDVRRTALRARPIRRHPELAPPDPAMVQAAVRVIRSGDRAATAARTAVVTTQRSDVLPHSSSAETLAALQEAVTAGSALWIGYLNAQGQASQRIVEPLRMAGGYLSAFDHRRNEVRTFAVHRITGVARLDDSDYTGTADDGA